MKRIQCLIISAIFILNLFTVNVFGKNFPLGEEIKVDRGKGKVKIKGNITEGPWKEVTVMVVNPLGGVDYIGQTTSGTEGAFTFSYKLKKDVREGQYLLLLGGSYTDSPVKKYFDFMAPGEVKDVKLSIGDGFAKIEWVDPEDEDLEGVNLYVNGKFYAFSEKNTGSLQKIKLNKKTTYTFTLKSVDRYGNESTGVNITGTP